MAVVASAHVHKAGRLAARLSRTAGGVEFRYDREYLQSGGPAVASTLPLNDDTLITPAGAVPAFFAGLLPEGRRLNALRRTVKTSADDELTLLAAVGTDTIGDVTVIAEAAPAENAMPLETKLSVNRSFTELRFAELLDEAGIAGRPSLAGVQDKVSASMISLPLSRQGERYILKLNPPENPHLVENEAFFIGLAKRSRLSAVSARLVHDADGEPGLLVTRFDRDHHLGSPRSLAVEDACQLLGKWPADKYAVTMEEVAASVMSVAVAPVVAARDIVRQLAYAWLTGNGDLHAKNLSVLDEPGIGYRVSPAYDLPSTLFYGDETLALTVGGRDTLSRARLDEFAASLGLTRPAAERAIESLLAATAELPEQIDAGALPFDRRNTAKAARRLRQRRQLLAG